MAVKVGLQHIEIWNDNLENVVATYEKEPLQKGQIVFYGPSYFTRWSPNYGMKPMRECLFGASGAACAVNRGFGSSSAEHQLYYYPRMVRPLEPKVLVYTSHANGPSFGYSDEESWELAQRVIAWAKTDFPGIRIYLVGAHPSRDEDAFQTAKKKRYNRIVKAFAEAARLGTCACDENWAFDIRTPLQALSKAEIIQKGIALGVDYSKTVSCYQADDSGAACGVCDSCTLRKKGFADAGVNDPTRYRK